MPRKKNDTKSHVFSEFSKHSVGSHLQSSFSMLTSRIGKLQTLCSWRFHVASQLLWRRNQVNSVSLTHWLWCLFLSKSHPSLCTLHTSQMCHLVPFEEQRSTRHPLLTVSLLNFANWTPWSGRREVLRCGHSCFSSQGHEGWLDRWLLPCVTFHQRCCWGWVNWKSELSWPVLQSCKIPQTTPNVNGKATLFDLPGFQPPLQTVLPSPSKS